VTRIACATIVILAAVLILVGGNAISAQDKYTLQVPDGLAYAEFRGYEDWAVISVSENGGKMVVILGNPSKRFADSAGWGWAAFEYDGASDAFSPATEAAHPPQGHDAKCGLACHTAVKERDYVFTEYAHR
jgi:hypothetical protein